MKYAGNLCVPRVSPGRGLFHLQPFPEVLLVAKPQRYLPNSWPTKLSAFSSLEYVIYQFLIEDKLL